MNIFSITFLGNAIAHMFLPVTDNGDRNLLLLYSLIHLPTMFSGFRVREVTLTLAGLRKERFISLNDPIQGIEIICCSRGQKAMTHLHTVVRSIPVRFADSRNVSHFCMHLK